MRTVVYGDILLAVNWIVDYFLLVGVAALTGVGARRRRLLAGGAVGALSALIFLAPPLPLWAQLLYQLASGTLVLCVAFPRRRLRTLGRLWGWWLLLGLGYGGAVLAAMYWLFPGGIQANNLAFYYDVSPLVLAGCILLMYLALRVLLRLFEPPASQRVVWAQAALADGDLHAEVLLDSGFCAEDVLLGQPLLLLSWPDTLGARGAVEPPQGGRPAQVKRAPWPAAALRGALAAWFAAPQAAQLARGLRLVPLHTAAGPTLAPGLTVPACINSRPVQVTLAFCDEHLCGGRVQGLFGTKSYEMIGGR